MVGVVAQKLRRKRDRWPAEERVSPFWYHGQPRVVQDLPCSLGLGGPYRKNVSEGHIVAK